MTELILISLWALLCLCCFVVNVGAYIYEVRKKYSQKFEFGFVFIILIVSMIPILNVIGTLSNFNEYITDFIKNYKKDK